MADENSSLLIERDGAVATLIINRPARRNAITWSMWQWLGELLGELGADPTVRVVVLTGAGESFSSGQDLGSDSPDLHPLLQLQVINEVVLALHRMPKICVARVDGDAVGAGLNLALACDIVVASDRSRFGEIFVRRGLSPDLGGSWILPRLIGLHRAKELCLTGDLIETDQAERMGLITRAVPQAELDRTVSALLDRLLLGAPIAQVLTKRLLNENGLRSLEDALDAEASAQVVNLGSPDVPEAFEAFRERRPAQFAGAWQPR
jgi:2-(1,2-epoxy-1,2-dihydrophenyl)acetyl-CoA isomerase